MITYTCPRYQIITPKSLYHGLVQERRNFIAKAQSFLHQPINVYCYGMSVVRWEKVDLRHKATHLYIFAFHIYSPMSPKVQPWAYRLQESVNSYVSQCDRSRLSELPRVQIMRGKLNGNENSCHPGLVLPICRERLTLWILLLRNLSQD